MNKVQEENKERKKQQHQQRQLENAMASGGVKNWSLGIMEKQHGV